MATSGDEMIDDIELDISRVFEGLCEIGDQPVDPISARASSVRLGWSVIDGDWGDNREEYFEVTTPHSPHRLRFVFANECTGGIVLSVLAEDDVVEEVENRRPYTRRSREDFDREFFHAKARIEGDGRSADCSGEYRSTFVEGALHFAVWRRRFWFVVLVQHDEGDGNYGHGPTLDLRLVPCGADASPPVFPLETNLIF